MLINCIESTVIKNSESLILSILNISNSYYARLLKLVYKMSKQFKSFPRAHQISYFVHPNVQNLNTLHLLKEMSTKSSKS